MPTSLKCCESDEDYARFTLYFIRHRAEFYKGFPLGDALIHILRSIEHSSVLLFEDAKNNLNGCVHYQYINANRQIDPEGEIAFVHFVVISKEHRGSRAFFEGFRAMVNQIAAENPRVKSLHFHALADNAYLNRLYSKFARTIGKCEDRNGKHNIYAAPLVPLLRYLNRKKPNRDFQVVSSF